MNTSSLINTGQIDIEPSVINYSGYVFREDAFGVIKRLQFLLRNIEVVRKNLDLDINEIKILDVGCGTGFAVTIPLANIGYFIKGIDVDYESINKAKILAKDISNISFSCQELSSLNKDKKFHIIICSEVLEHIDEPNKLLEQMKTHLISNGLLLITVPNGYGYFELESPIYERFPKFVSYLDLCQQAYVERYGSKELFKRHKIERSPEYCNMACSSLDKITVHCNRFTTNKIKNLMLRNNYEIIEFKNRTFLAGNIINILLRESDSLLNLNGKIADFLPKWMCSDWMISAKKTSI